VPNPRVTFFGAVGEVTGSCALLEAGDARVLIDCGLIQGTPEDEARNAIPLPVDGRSLDAVVITHAHVDHCGRVPLLPRLGYTGPVYATRPTAELLGPVLYSSARLQHIRRAEHEAARRGAGVRRPRHSLGGGLEPIEDPPSIQPPVQLYDSPDVDAALSDVRPLAYGREERIAPGVTLRFLDACHIIGSACVELTIGRGASRFTLVFSGDLGPSTAPLLPSAQPPSHADAVVLESTYGDRLHPKPGDTLRHLAKIIAKAKTNRDRIVIPTFALGRAQQLLYRLGQLSADGRLLQTPVYLDSKMAVTGSEAYARHRDLLSPEAAEMFQRGQSPMHFPELYYIANRQDSKRLNTLRGGGIILAGAGFCHGGPILHHLNNALWRQDARVLFIGHQPPGTLAHAIASGQEVVEILGHQVRVEARIHTMGGFSGHADQNDLVAWVGGITPAPTRILLNHGDDGARLVLADKIAEAIGVRAELPDPGQTIQF
jgi:metallo-beta-lactamase family protein